ncbi:MAG: hypothetical protein K2Q04_21435, partial [Hyphomicrobium sp.]|nr:hypothetical protein [Hyphomicrobium sp.]
MAPRLRTTLALVALWPWPALSEPASVAPDLDCSKGFEALRNWAAWLPGAGQVSGSNPNVVTVAQPDV